MRHSVLRTFFCAVLAILAAVASSCGGGSGSSSSYGGPGSEWSISLTGFGGFTLTEATSGLSVTGTYVTLASGFLELTVSTSNQSSPAVGEKAYGLNIPGFMFVLKPISGTQTITMMATGSCPTTDQSYNWMKTNTNVTSAYNSKDLYGTATWTASSGAMAVTHKYAVNAPTTDLGSNALGTMTCANSVGSVNTAKMYFTTGGAIVNTDTTTSSNSEFIIAMTASSLASTALDGSYVGLLFTESANSVYPVNIVVSGSSMTVNSVNVNTGVSDGVITGSPTIGTLNSPQNGLFVLTLPGGTKAGCEGMINAGGTSQKTFACSGNPPGGTANQFFTLIATSI